MPHEELPYSEYGKKKFIDAFFKVSGCTEDDQKKNGYIVKYDNKIGWHYTPASQ